MFISDIFKTEHTRKSFWGTPQFTPSGMFWFTVFFGFFGLHHLYLRSPQTAVASFLVNCLSLGYWWMYDLVQLRSESLEELNTHGMSSPFGPLGLAQGMFAEPEQLKALAQARAQTEADSGSGSDAPNPLYSFFYYLVLPVFAAGAIALAGDIPNAVSRILYMLPILLIFFLPVFNFLFFLNIPAWGYDMWRAFITPKTLFERGHSRFTPFTTFFGFDVDGHSPNLQKPGATEKPCPPRSFFETLLGMFQNISLMGLPFLRIVAPQLAISIEKGMAVATSAKEKATLGVETAAKAVSLAKAVPDAVASVAQGFTPDALKKEVESRAAAAAAAAATATAATTAGLAALPSPVPSFPPLTPSSFPTPQLGGGSGASGVSGANPNQATNDPLLAGLTAMTLLGLLVGGFLFTGVRSLNDTPPQQSTVLDDSPPKPRAV